jgi:hypothetical protein
MKRQTGNPRSGGVSRSVIRSHPAPSAAALGTAAALGFGSVLLLFGSPDRKLGSLRKLLPATAALKSQLRVERRPGRNQLVVGGAIATACVAGTFFLLDAIMNHPDIRRFDHHLHNALRQRRTNTMKKIVKATTAVGSSGMIVPLNSVVAYNLIRRGKPTEGIAVMWNMAGTILLAEVLKNIVQRQRPPEGQKDKDAYSFPSGHTLTSAAAFGMLAYLLVHDDELGAWSIPAAAMLAVLISWTAFSRVYLGMHWASDTLASLGLATAWNATLITVLRTR